MSWCGSITCIVRIIVTFQHGFRSEHSCDNDEEEQEFTQKFETFSTRLIPHLLIELMKFLHNGDVAPAFWSVSQKPYSKILHIPNMTLHWENFWSLWLENGLLVVAGGSVPSVYLELVEWCQYCWDWSHVIEEFLHFSISKKY